MIKINEMSYLDEYEINKLRNALLKRGYTRPFRDSFFFVYDISHKNERKQEHITFKLVFSEQKEPSGLESHLDLLITVLGKTADVKDPIRDVCRKLVERCYKTKPPMSKIRDLHQNSFEVSKVVRLESVQDILNALKITDSFLVDVQRVLEYWKKRAVPSSGIKRR